MNNTAAMPLCPHFGHCGGCQHQDVLYEAQVLVKREHLKNLLTEAEVRYPDNIAAYTAEPYHYRNRIRLRVEHSGETFQLGYNQLGTTAFQPINECPIAAPSLWSAATSLITAAASDRDALYWLNAASEVELFCNHDQSQLQLTLLCAPRTKSPQGSFARAYNAFVQQVPKGLTLVGAGAIATDPRTGPTGRILAEAGSSGLNYRVGDELYWITRGGFFQVNRFLLETLVDLVCTHNSTPRTGLLAWDLFSGVGLFSRVLARSFAQVAAVESNPTAIADLRNAFRKLGASYTAIESTALDYLRAAVLQREQPELVVLDPPRSGADVEACELLNRIAPKAIVYVSCDPATLARDLAILQRQYEIASLHAVDLFPQTFHLETVAILHRTR
ncbi:23S rRNA (uracil(1939)-C(5))-methyltransferase RlmD [Granulicella sp. 5B5]|uniref:class I SAM-dependent RNA methyltransferase n=1 Tax=Granulicella sp. 5B5 TaxID=1617967 RepID=UPI0015F7022A|nr:RsmD family RNA methyltransferase [Granulicella sp. 5B5]QMV19041.1 23S rRNA (uracil(1939)-C(5))-methyltransferase RlmD [Granulicella sp. 5B5]